MGKYTPLEDWLRGRPEDSVELTFARIEEIIRDNLPPSAHKHFIYWENRPGVVAINAILNAGFRVVMVDMEKGRVRFRRI